MFPYKLDPSLYMVRHSYSCRIAVVTIWCMCVITCKSCVHESIKINNIGVIKRSTLKQNKTSINYVCVTANSQNPPFREMTWHSHFAKWRLTSPFCDMAVAILPFCEMTTANLRNGDRQFAKWRLPICKMRTS